MNVLKYKIKKPSDCSENELNAFYEILISGEAVLKNNLKEIIANCHVLAFCYTSQERIVGISAVRKPTLERREKIIEKTQIMRKPEELIFEAAFSVTLEEYRGLRISYKFHQLLVEEVKHHKGWIYAMSTLPVCKQLVESGYVQKGNSYDGLLRKGWRYYECELAG